MLSQLPEIKDPNLLVGLSTSDDAAVYKLNKDLAIVQTVDFFPPIVDDAFDYGMVAVANALSDVYAMGAKPILGLNVVGFPTTLPISILSEILKGGAHKAKEAGVLIVGGHTVDDTEPKYGLSVTGVVKPGSEVTNSSAKPGDSLVLTKPIGTGIITTGGKQQVVKPEILDNAVKVMSVLNKAASEAMIRVGVNACSDVTGFGLLGHLREIVIGSDVGARINVSSIPILKGARELLESGIVPGGTRRNLESVDDIIDWHSTIDENTKLLLADAQTSGGLLISCAENKLGELLEVLEASEVDPRAVIGKIVEKDSLNGKRFVILP